MINNTMETIPAKDGKKAIRFKRGGLHQSLGVPAKEKIPQDKFEAALHGKYGDKAEKQARFAVNVLGHK